MKDENTRVNGSQTVKMRGALDSELNHEEHQCVKGRKKKGSQEGKVPPSV